LVSCVEVRQFLRRMLQPSKSNIDVIYDEHANLVTKKNPSEKQEPRQWV
jgi:hypothetical protein